MSRRICVDLYDVIIKLRPEWHDDDDDKGVIKVVMTGSASDPVRLHPHVRNKTRRENIKKRLKNSDDPLKLVIVRDMWLTGFDAPVLNSLTLLYQIPVNKSKMLQPHDVAEKIAEMIFDTKTYKNGDSFEMYSSDI